MQIANKKESVHQSAGSSIIQVLSTYLPYWPLFVIFSVLSVLGGFIFLRYSIPKYEANATIIIKDEKKGYDDSKLMESLDRINKKKII